MYSQFMMHAQKNIKFVFKYLGSTLQASSLRHGSVHHGSFSDIITSSKYVENMKKYLH